MSLRNRCPLLPQTDTKWHPYYMQAAIQGVYWCLWRRGSNGSANILQLNSWEGYKALLEDGSYKDNAYTLYPALSQQVTVYTFADFRAPEQYDAATQAISFTIDPAKTTILQYGFEGAEIGDDGFADTAILCRIT